MSDWKQKNQSSPIDSAVAVAVAAASGGVEEGSAHSGVDNSSSNAPVRSASSAPLTATSNARGVATMYGRVVDVAAAEVMRHI